MSTKMLFQWELYREPRQHLCAGHVDGSCVVVIINRQRLPPFADL